MTKEITPELVERIRQLASEGQSASKIAPQVGLMHGKWPNYKAVLKIAEEHGIVLKKKGKGRPKGSKNKNGGGAKPSHNNSQDFHLSVSGINVVIHSESRAVPVKSVGVTNEEIVIEIE